VYESNVTSILSPAVESDAYSTAGEGCGEVDERIDTSVVVFSYSSELVPVTANVTVTVLKLTSSSEYK
jgi:hypothetical protein